MSRYTVKAIDDLAGIHDGLVKLAGAELGVQSFGLQVLDFPAGFAHYPEHDHSEDGQEEVYVVLQGSAEFTVDGEQCHSAPAGCCGCPPVSSAVSSRDRAECGSWRSAAPPGHTSVLSTSS
jgi:hypothetical protein